MLATASAQQPKQAQGKSAAVTASVEPTLLGQYGDWQAFAASPGGKKVCFALGKPKSSVTNPAGRKRDPAYIFISNRPAENVKNEVSVIIGYPFKSSADASAEIGPTKFAMYTQNDGAWIKNVAEEARMIEAMRKGAELTVKGTSSRGTTSTDQFSLKGLSQALDRADQECK
jgi:invasion protein IalB